MIKRERFENFIKSYDNYSSEDFSWDNSLGSYESGKIQKMYQFYQDIFQYDIKYKMLLIKSFAVLILGVGILVFSLMTSNDIYNFVIAKISYPYNYTIAMISSTTFLIGFVLVLVVTLKKMFKE